MFSVILPTMWRIPTFLDDLKMLDMCELVGEVLLINNDIRNTPAQFNILNFNKIIEIKPPKNMYINPSWNLGIRAANYDKIFIKNDDITFDYTPALISINDELEREDCIIGTHLEHSNNIIKEKEETCIYYKEILKRDIGFGCGMFLNKKSYIPINKKILIWYGDDFITESYSRRNLKIKTIHGINIKGQVSATVDHVDELIKIKHTDEDIWNANKELLFTGANV